MQPPVIATAQGSVEGLRDDGIVVFKGIPYAAPPVGELRFRPPAPAPAWSGVRAATRSSPLALQHPIGMDTLFGGKRPRQDEGECLTLNVWAPADAEPGTCPVMVWIHGGAFVTGSGSMPWYRGRGFAANGIVVVTINYRLGALGFMHLAGLVEGADDSGNLGLLDQVAALRWVQQNIAAFGGDPTNVTVFGESAGAMSIGTLLAVPDANGLFHKAILQSGTGHHVRTVEEAEAVAADVLGALGVAPAEADRLRQLPAETIIEAQAAVTAGHGILAFSPVVDGRVVPRHPVEALAAGAADGIPLIAGTTRDEMKLFAMLDPSLVALEDDQLLVRAAEVMGSVEAAEKALAVYRGNRPDTPASALFLDLATDYAFRVPAIRLLENHAARGNAAYGYLFTYATPVFGGLLGSSHALEIPFVFDALDAPAAAMFTGPADDSMRTLASAMHQAWTSFARTGVPAAAGLPEWPAYDTDRRSTMVFDRSCRVEDDPNADEREVWAGAR